MSAGTFFSKPEYPDRESGRGRPKAVNPVTGREQSWTSPSTFASALDNPYGLMRRDGRNIVMGISARPDLATMALAGALRDNVAKVDEVIATAKEVMGSSAAANLGTAAHAAITNAWRHPEQPVPEPYVLLVKSFAAALKEHGLRIVAAELKVMNLAYNALGELDFVFEELDGSLVIGDAKSGNLEHACRKFAVQMAMYDGAEYVLNADGTAGPISRNYFAHSHGVIVHLDLENNAVSLYRVDLRIGRWGAGLAEQVRAWHKLDPLMPYVAPVGERKRSVAQAAMLTPTVPSHHDGGPMIPPVGAVFEHEADEQAEQRLAELDHVAVAGEDAPEQSTAERFDELMRLDKAPLQMLLKKTFGWTDDAHNRRWLARAVVALENGLEGRDVVKYAAAKDDTAPSAAEVLHATVAETAPAGGPSAETLLQAIAGANSEGAIEALRKDLVERRGDQAWTDELVSAARARVLELLAASGNAVGESARTLAQIKQAESKEALKDIWERVTMGNTVPEKWTEEFTKAGLDRLDEIAKATPPPPANPFA